MRKTSLMILLCAVSLSLHGQTWQFAVSGDSRDCGDVVMPAIANSIATTQAQLSSPLGDFRKIYDFDEDMQATQPPNKPPHINNYETAAWPDYMAQQVPPLRTLNRCVA